MKKLLLILLPVFLLVLVGGAVWWKYGRTRDPFAHAQLLMEKGDLQGAVLELRTIVKQNPQNVTAHFRLGQVDLRLGDPVAAEKELRQARDMGFDARSVNALLAQAYMAQGKYKELLRAFSPQGLPPEQASPLLILRAAAQLATGDNAGAQASAAEAERLMPQSVEAQLNSAKIALALHDLSGAGQKVERALSINPRAGDALLLKGQLQNLQGDRVGAISTFGQAVAAAPNLLAARLERANALVASNEDAKAREDIDDGAEGGAEQCAGVLSERRGPGPRQGLRGRGRTIYAARLLHRQVPARLLLPCRGQIQRGARRAGRRCRRALPRAQSERSGRDQARPRRSRSPAAATRRRSRS